MTAWAAPNLDPTPARRALRELCAPFFEDMSWVDHCRVVDPAQMPPSAQTLLAHGGHMTATLRAHYQGVIALQVQADCALPTLYSRRILLTVDDPRRVVELGVVRLNLELMPDSARRAILAKETPLGDVLTSHGVMTKVEPRWFIQFPSSGPVVECFERGPEAAAFGRVGTIHCNGEEAIELLEVVAVSEPGAQATGLGVAGDRNMTPR